MNGNFLAYMILNQSSIKLCVIDAWTETYQFSSFFLFFFYRTTSSFKGNAWLTYSYATFQIFARNAVDGTPLQYGDLVAFKYPYGGRSRWLSYYSYYYYARDCSANSKSSCARQNTYTGFKIFKKL